MGYEEQLAARRMAEEALEAADGRAGRGRKRALPGALEGEAGLVRVSGVAVC
jgi:hypothetical protein